MIKRSGLILLPTILSVFIFFSACKNTSNKTTTESNYRVNLVRFEQELFSIDLYSLVDSASVLVKKYPEFSALFANRIIEIGDTTTPFFGQGLIKFATNQTIYTLNNLVDSTFSDFDRQVKTISKGLENYKKHFPEKNIPTVYTYVSGLNQSIVVAENILGISLDKYLGKDEPVYNSVYPPIPEYLKRTMQPAYIAPDAIRAWVVTDIEYKPTQENFLSRVLNEARAIYITKQLLPEINDTLLWGFSNNDLEFCISNESEMWKYLIEQKLLFSTDNFRISKFVDPGPFTKDFTSDSPARAAVWIGFQIIEEYMSRSKNRTLSDLAALKDFQYLLNESRYNP